jgi:hypothetical protein
LSEELRIKVSVNKAQRRIFESKEEAVASGWNTLNIKDLHNFYLELTLSG